MLKPPLRCRHGVLLISLGFAGEEEPGDTAANQKAYHCQHGGEPRLHTICAIVGNGHGCALHGSSAFSSAFCGRRGGSWDGEAVHLCEDVRMLLENTEWSNLSA